MSSNNLLIHDKKLLVNPGTTVSLKDYDTGYTAGFKNKDEAKSMLRDDIEIMSALQDKLYASGDKSLLIVFQAMDAAGKDSTIKHVMTGINPQGCIVHSFKQPTKEELQHDFLWRIEKALPEKGKIGIFNRSHYEEVLVVRVHPQYILPQNIEGIDSIEKITEDFWKQRFEQINNFEKTISDYGTKIVKFFLHVSKEEQKKRFLKRIKEDDKNWKFSSHDIEERKYWDSYMKAYEEMLSNTSTDYAPWYIIPADNKWFMRGAVADILVGIMEEMNLKYPEISEEQKKELKLCKKALQEEN